MKLTCARAMDAPLSGHYRSSDLISKARSPESSYAGTRCQIRHNSQVALAKPEIAIEEIDRVITSGARFGCVLADLG
jgi:hypothetical protein